MKQQCKQIVVNILFYKKIKSQAYTKIDNSDSIQKIIYAVPKGLQRKINLKLNSVGRSK